MGKWKNSKEAMLDWMSGPPAEGDEYVGHWLQVGTWRRVTFGMALGALLMATAFVVLESVFGRIL